MSRLLLISNRLPVQVRRVGRKPVVTPSAGGLVAGLLPIHESGEGLWIGSLGQNPTPALARELRERRLVTVNLPKEAATRHYEGYSNQVLWPLCHYLTSRVHFDTRDFDAYESVNARFADAVMEVARPDDTIWVHDYHLMLLPRMLRDRLPQARIGFFLHIPFPSSEVFRVLPRKHRILDGLLGANLIGLHTYDYARHLATSFRRISGVEFDDDWFAQGPDRCKLGVFPLGVDVDAMDKQAHEPATEKRLTRITKQLQGRKLVLGVDRLDYTKGLVPRVLAFRRLLAQHPEWQGKVTFLQLVVPSRDTIGSYNDLKRELERLIGETNGLYAREGLTPIQYMYRSVPPDELAAMYRAADVMFVTPVRDGMNLVCKEYVAARFDNGGSVVLSEFAGAASEMGEALTCNPWDIDGTADVLHRALVMPPEEMRKRMKALRKRNEANNVHRWVARFLDTLEDAARPSGPRLDPASGDGWQAECLRAYRKSQRAFLALDYDGTVSDVAPTPESAAPTPPLRTLLTRLGRISRLELLLISGRDADTMFRWFGDLPVHLVSEHGFFMRLRGQGDWQEAARGADLSWKHAVREVMEEYASRAPGVIIEDKRAALAWHYRLVEPAFGSWLARELAQHLAESFSQSPLAVHHGKKVVEVRPNGVDKGGAYKLLEQRLGPFDFVFAAGDDKTDEDLFQALPARAFSVKVGPGPTRARFRIESPAALRAFLEELVRQSATMPEQFLSDA